MTNTKRQIILIMTDTQRKDMVGCYGNPNMFTPHLDKLAQEGIKFENAYCCCKYSADGWLGANTYQKYLKEGKKYE